MSDEDRLRDEINGIFTKPNTVKKDDVTASEAILYFTMSMMKSRTALVKTVTRLLAINGIFATLILGKYLVRVLFSD